MSTTLSREELIAALVAVLGEGPDVDAAWEGGSAAFGNVDAWSDIDAVAVVADDAVDRTFERVQAALEALSPVTLRYDTPGAVGFAQKFYRLRDAGDFLMVDLVLLRRSDPLIFREVELHGHGTTWFDRRGLLVEAHVDAQADAAAAAARVQGLATHFRMFQPLVVKEGLRGRAVDAMAFYQAMTLRPLAETLRLLHRPARRNFGLRYLWLDLPVEDARRFERLAFVADLEDLRAKHTEAMAWFEDCVARLEAAAGSR